MRTISYMSLQNDFMKPIPKGWGGGWVDHAVRIDPFNCMDVLKSVSISGLPMIYYNGRLHGNERIDTTVPLY